MSEEFLDFQSVVNAGALNFLSGFNPKKYSGYRLRLFNIYNQALDLGPQLSMQYSIDGSTFDNGDHYSSLMSDSFTGEAVALVTQYSLEGVGHRLALDNPEVASVGISGDVDIFSPGVVNGQNVVTSVTARTVRSQGTGGIMGANVSGFYTGANGTPILGLRLQSTPYGGGQENITGAAALYGILNGAPPVLAVSLATSQSFGANTVQNINFDTVDTDTRGWWDVTNKRFNPKWAGRYRVFICVEVSGTFNIGDTVRIQPQKNSGMINESRWCAQSTIATANIGSVLAEGIVSCNGTTDYINAAVYSEGASLAAVGTVARMDITYMGP